MNSSGPRPELRSGIFFFGLSLFVIWESLRTDLGTLKMPGPGFVLFAEGMVFFAISLVLVCRGWGIRGSLKAHSRRVFIAFLSLVVYSLVLARLGFIVATFPLICILFQLGKPRRWWTLLGMSALVTLLAYLFFGTLLHVYLPRGLLPRGLFGI